MRRLTADEQRLWARVVETVRPLGHLKAPEAPPGPERLPTAAKPAPPAPKPAPAPPRAPGTPLDASWDRRLARGAVAPDAMLDLHGHNLATAYDLLDRRLEQAIADGARLLLLVTGKPPGGDRPVKRGAIPAAAGDWLAGARPSGRNAAPPHAPPRPGGPRARSAL